MPFSSLSNHLFLCAIAEKRKKKFLGRPACLVVWFLESYTTKKKKRDNLKGGWIYWLYIAASLSKFLRVNSKRQGRKVNFISIFSSCYEHTLIGIIFVWHPYNFFRIKRIFGFTLMWDMQKHILWVFHIVSNDIERLHNFKEIF